MRVNHFLVLVPPIRVAQWGEWVFHCFYQFVLWTKTLSRIILRQLFSKDIFLFFECNTSEAFFFFHFENAWGWFRFQVGITCKVTCFWRQVKRFPATLMLIQTVCSRNPELTTCCQTLFPCLVSHLIPRSFSEWHVRLSKVCMYI